MSTLHKIALTFLKNIGPVTSKSLLAYFGNAEAIFSATKSDLSKIPGIQTRQIAAITDKQALLKAEEELRFIDKHQIDVLFYTDDRFPQRLKNCFDAPILLYFKGNTNFNHPRIISVVGTRNATSYGESICKVLAKELQPYNIQVISGLAYGIDVAMHKACVDENIPTIGVLGHGLDRLYPKVHKSTAQKMVHNGGLLTEFPINTMPDRQNFPQRNRIIAGISDATIVVEASAKGGALITAEIANSYNRDVFAYPGRIHDNYSLGCNFLVKTNRAALITQTSDLIHALNWDLKEAKITQNLQVKMPLNLSVIEQKLYEILKDKPLSIDQISINLNIAQSKLAIHILKLEMEGVIISLPGKMYKILD